MKETLELQEDIIAVTNIYGRKPDELWSFSRCSINKVIFHSTSYQRVTVRNNFTAVIAKDDASDVSFASIVAYYKVTDCCTNAKCNLHNSCTCHRQSQYYAVCKLLDPLKKTNLPQMKGIDIVSHIIKVREDKRCVFVFVSYTVEILNILLKLTQENCCSSQGHWSKAVKGRCILWLIYLFDAK